jgi:alpha-glucosidase
MPNPISVSGRPKGLNGARAIPLPNMPVYIDRGTATAQGRMSRPDGKKSMNIGSKRAMAVLLVAVGFLSAAAGQTSVAKPVTVLSPDGTIKMELSAPGGIIQYRVMVDGKPVLAPSRLGIEADNVEFGKDAVLGAVTSRKVDERYRFFGAHAEAVNRANEATVSVLSHGEAYFVDVHVANDGVGVRLRLPAKMGRKVQADQSTWKLEGDPVAWAQ